MLQFLVAAAFLAPSQGWQPPSRLTQTPIWPGIPPDARPAAGPEIFKSVGKFDFVAGKTWTEVDNVSRPTMTRFEPKGKNTGAAVVVFPGGGYEILAIDLEGTEVCEWLASRGITGILLKYRVPAPRSEPYWGAYPQSPIALEDAQRTLGLVRLHAKEWHVDPLKIGVLGFSAGGHLVAAISTHFAKRLYRPIDDADRFSCRPDFAVALYPGHILSAGTTHSIVPVTRRTPPTLLVQAQDDPVDSVNNSRRYYAALKKAGVPAELHIYTHGGHGFGIRRTKLPITRWPELMEGWLKRTHVIR